MKMVWLALGAVALLLSFGHTGAEEVIAIKGESSFNDVLKNNDFVVMEFYAPWCGHCKNLAPEYEKAAAVLKKNDPPIVLAKVDATEEENKALAEKFEVKGFPTLKIFRGGNAGAPQDYNGPREAVGIAEYLVKLSGPASVEVATSAELTAFKTGKDVVIVGVFKADSSEFKAFSAAADALRDDFNFVHSFNAELGKGGKAPSVVLFKTYDDPETAFSGKYADLKAWIEGEASPLLPEMDQKEINKKALQKVFGSDLPKVLAFVSKDDASAAEWKTKLKEQAKATKTVLFVFSESETNEGAVNYFGLKAADVPALVVHENAGGKYVKPNAKASDIKAFVADYQGGKLEKTIKSEEAPADNSGPVKIVTANTLDEIVFSGKNVLIEFYAPWCGHCKSLEPKYVKVGETFADNDSVVIAKMDATANDVVSDKFSVRGFPTIYFVDSRKEVHLYAGDRSEEDLIKYVEEHAVGASSTKAPEAAKKEASKEDVPKDEL